MPIALPSSVWHILLQVLSRSRSQSRSEAGGTTTPASTVIGSARQARGSIRELYADWCAAVRMHAHASALSTAPPTMAQRAGAGASSAAAFEPTTGPPFKGPRPVLSAVEGEPDVMSVSASGMDRLWLDQLKLTRCCMVEVWPTRCVMEMMGGFGTD